MTTPKQVCVKWLDACFHNKQMSLKEAKKLKLITTSTNGFLISQNKDLTIIAMEYYEEVDVYDKFVVIPTSLILKEDKIK